MSLTLEMVRENTKRFDLIKSFDIVRNESARISTPFQYPEGSYIDVFLKEPTDILGTWYLSDMGQTMAYLLDIHVKPWTTSRRKQIVMDICNSLNIEMRGGNFGLSITDEQIATNLPSAIIRLAQACIRIADLGMTQRLRTAPIFKED